MTLEGVDANSLLPAEMGELTASEVHCLGGGDHSGSHWGVLVRVESGFSAGRGARTLLLQQLRARWTRTVT
jgi:hypothetical protein